MSDDLIKRLRCGTMRFDWSDIPDDALIPAVPLLREAADALAAKDAALSEMRSELERVRVQFENTAQVRDTLYRDLDRVKAELERARKALSATLTWAEQRCPCHHEEPNPCSLCGASVENLEACKSAENTLPRHILEMLRSARPRALASQDEGEER